LPSLAHKSLLARSLLLAVIVPALALGGCNAFKSKPKTPTLGERIPVLNFETRAVAEPELAELTVVLPPAEVNADWSQPGGSPSKAMGHLALSATPAKAWSVSIGNGSTTNRRLNATPVMLDGVVYTMDTSARVRAFDAKGGALLWQAEILGPTKSTDAAFGGGVGGANGRVFATTGYGTIVAYDAKSGNELWRKSIPVPLRGGPTVEGNRVFAMSQDNQIHAFTADKGDELWTVSGTVEVAGMLSIGAPAVAQETVVVGFSSGELSALRAENGRTVWADALTRTGRSTAMAALSDIDASPVIDRGRVYAIGHGGRLAALEIATGQRAWERNFAGTSTPWVAGEFLFIVTIEGEVVCITRSDGKVRWVYNLPAYGNPKKRKDPIIWSGPVLAGEKLYLVGSNKQMVTVSPVDGTLIATTKIEAPAYLTPIVADSTMYLLTDDGKLTAYR
jgi:outer membrane protein assembly factor BamB